MGLMMRFVLSIVGVAALLAGPADAIEVQPRLWQDSKTANINGKVYPPEVMTDCIKPEDDIVKAAQVKMKEKIKKDEPQGCSKFDIKETGNGILVEMKCGDPKEDAIEVSMTMTMTVNLLQSTTKEAKATMRMDGQTMVTSAKTESKWISTSCDSKK